MAARSKLTKMYGEICSYAPPAWAKDLRVKPTSRVNVQLPDYVQEHAQLCMRPTPIHKWSLSGVPDDFQVSVKREDLTGSTLTGNKVRKLEFLLADAIQQGCDSVVTFGGPQSNHARATVIAARELGLQTHLMVLSLTENQSLADNSYQGNALLNRLSGAKFVVFPTRTDITRAHHLKIIHQRMKEYADKLSAEGHKTYCIPAGGSSTIGAWGYVDAFDEMMQQGVLEDFDDIVVAAGSVGTVCGLAVAKYLTGAKIGLHAVATHNTEEFIYDHIDGHLQELGLSNAKARELVDAIMEYTGKGYGRSTEDELETIVEVFSQTGVSLDPEFCVKGVRGMVGEMNKNPGRFVGKRVLFIQSGGVYGLFDGRMDHVARASPITNQVYKASDIFPS